MTNPAHQRGAPIDVAVIGGGPAGLAAATMLKDRGVARVVVLEREPQAGGIPRHCGHPPFGLREFKRILTGPDYAARLVSRALARGVEIHTLTSVVAIAPGGTLTLTTPDGVEQITPRRVIYATGVRETPRSARMISGARVRGVLNTGALQSMVYLKMRRPFRRPVIVGTELVAFSALMTCAHAGMRPVAMIEARSQVTARWPSALFPRLKGVTLRTDTQLLEIKGTDSVEAVTVLGPDGRASDIPCDGVILSGQFIPEATLARCAHLKVDPATGGPRVDQWGRCSDPVYFATGNLLRPVETAGHSWIEGCKTADWVAQDLAGTLPTITPSVMIETHDPGLKYAMPQLIRRDTGAGGMRHIQVRVTRSVNGKLIANHRGKPIWEMRLNSRPERRIKVPIAEILSRVDAGAVEFSIQAPKNASRVSPEATTASDHGSMNKNV